MKCITSCKLSILQVKLKDALVTAAKFSRANDAELAWIDAVIDVQLNADKEQVRTGWYIYHYICYHNYYHINYYISVA